MPVVDKALGIVVPRRIGEPLAAGVAAAQTEFGFGVTNPANSIREVIEAIGAMPFDAREQDAVDLAQQFDNRHNSGQFLDAGLWPLATRNTPQNAAGIVHLNYRSIVTSPDPVFAAGDLEFFDGAGRRYTGTDDISPPSTIHDTSGQTGQPSEVIGSGTSRLSQQVAVQDTDFPQAVRIGSLVIVTGTPTATVRIETDSAGSPSGVLADDRLILEDLDLVAGTNDFVFDKGAVLPTEDYHIVFIVSGGTVTFDGNDGGAANQVKVYSGSWANSTQIENANLKFYNGGEFPVVAAELGSAGNIEPGSIGSYRANNGPAQTRFDTIVGAGNFENLLRFRGGLDEEEDEVFRSRVRKASALRGTTSPGGMVFALTNGDDAVDGVTFADIRENFTMDWGQEETVLDNSGKTGTNGDLIDGVTYTKQAFRFIVGAYGSISAIAFKLAVDSSSTITFRIETDASGSPSGTLASPNWEATGVVPGGTARVAITFDEGDFIEEGTYWLVAERTAGSFRFDGSNADATDNVKRHTGAAWELSTAIEDGNIEVYGGIPPKDFELFVEGGSDNDVAQGIYRYRPPGKRGYGNASGTALDKAGREVLQRFSRITYIDTVFDVEVQVTSAFAGTADDIRDLISEYLEELAIGETVVREEAKARLLVGDVRTTGVYDVVKFRLGRKEDFATPGLLTSAEVVNLTNSFGERFRMFSPSTDIDVTLTSV